MHVLENVRDSNVRLSDLRELCDLKEGVFLAQKKTRNRIAAGHREERPKAL